MQNQKEQHAENQLVKVYLRPKDKRSFIMMLKSPIFLSELKDIIIKKINIPSEDILAVWEGKQHYLNQLSQYDQVVQLKDKTIIHIINKKNTRNDVIEIIIKFVYQNNTNKSLGETKFFAKTSQTVKNFIKNQVISVIQGILNTKIKEQDLTIISNGRVLQLNYQLSHYYIQDGAQLTCVINNSSNSDNKKMIFHETSQPKHILQNKLQSKPSNQSQQFVKLKKFQSKAIFQEIFASKYNDSQKQQDQDEQRTKSKLKKKQKITSSDVIKFQQQNFNKIQERERISQELVSLYGKISQHKSIQQKDAQRGILKAGDFVFIRRNQKISPNQRFHKLAQKFSKFLNRNVMDSWYHEPDSPIQVEYPKIQRKVQQPQHQTSQNSHNLLNSFNTIQEKSSKFQFLGNINEKFHAVVESRQQKLALKKKSFSKIEQKTDNYLICRGDFLMIQRLKIQNQLKNNTNNIRQLLLKFDDLLHQKFGEEEQNSAISVQYPKIQRKIPVKAGDFILCGQIFSKRANSFDNLVDKFNQVVQKLPKSDQSQNYLQIQDQSNPQQAFDQNYLTPLKQNTSAQYPYLQDSAFKQGLISELQQQKNIKLGDHLFINKIDFSKPKSKVLQSIIGKYSHLTFV